MSKNRSDKQRAYITLKSIFLRDQNWYHFHQQYQSRIRDGIIDAVVKFLSCKNRVRGVKEYGCSSPRCSHTKTVAFTCKSRLCSCCGKKATLLWVNRQGKRLPAVPYQHLVFTLPDTFRSLFWSNRFLLNEIGALAVKCMKKALKKQNLITGIFLAIHTFGSDLKRHVHVHLSIALGGLNADHTAWQTVKPFHANQLFPLWRAAVIKWLRDHFTHGRLTLVDKLSYLQQDPSGFNRLLDQYSKIWWNVFCQKPSEDHKRNAEYFIRYVKRPVIANGKLYHYGSTGICFRFYDHKKKRYVFKRLSAFEFIRAVIQHIPDKGFRLIRYYGFLSNRLAGKCLPIISTLLNLPTPEKQDDPTYVSMMQQAFNFNPLTCILCGSPMVLTRTKVGCSVSQLFRYHQQLALAKPCF